MSSIKPKRSFYYGWWVVIACAVIQFYLGGTFYQGFSAIFNPIVENFDWSYTAVSLAFTFRGFESGIMAPIVGILVDRFGPRKLMVTGIVISGLGFWFFSKIDALWNFYGAFLFLALGLSLGTGVVTMSAVARWFRTRTGLAMGILTSGFGASGLLMPLVVQLVDNLGWRESSVIFGIGTAVLCFPLAFLVKDPPEMKATAPQEKSSAAAKPPSSEMRPGEVLKSRDFWLLSVAVLFGGLAGQAIMVHQIPYLVSVGISRQAAGMLAIVLSVSNIAGRLFFGYVGDKVEKRRAFAVGVGIKAVGVLGFALATSTGQFIPALIALGIGFGGLIPLRPALQLEFFGIKSFATIQGFLMISITIGSILSPLFAGWMFDVRDSYRPAFIVLAAATLLAVPVVLWSHKRR
jgi:MFS transporter, OFA family, oxalate/formate antiporter